jgi:hypothetical protein
LSSAIWYFALHCSQKNFTVARSGDPQYPNVTVARKSEAPRGVAQLSWRRCSRTDALVSSSGANSTHRSHISTALFLNPAFS